MAEESHVALIAVRWSGVPGEDAEAVVIGTVGAGLGAPWREGDWRYARYALATLQGMLRDGTDPLGTAADAALVKEGDTLEVLTSDERDDADTAGVKKSFLTSNVVVHLNNGTTQTLPRGAAVLRVTGVERVSFFTFNNGDMLPGAQLKAYAALGTVAPSKLLLFPDYVGPTKRGALTAMVLQFEVEVAANGNRVKTGAPPDQDATRLLLDLGVVRDSATKSLWTIKSGAPDPLHGAQFDVLPLRCSIAARSTGEKHWRSNAANPVKAGDLTKLADANLHKEPRVHWTSFNGAVVDEGQQQPSSASDLYRIDRLPLLASMDLPVTVFADRDFGFRRCSRDSDDPLLVWRFETTPLAEHELAKRLRINPRFVRLLPLPSPAPSTDPFAKLFDDRDRVLLVEEQSVSDVVFDRQRSAPRGTMLTIEMRANSPAAQAQRKKDLTEYAVGRFDAVIKKVHEGLKLVRDGRPISLLPRLAAPTTTLAWNAVGMVTRSPAVGAQLMSFEPCFADNPWTPATEVPPFNAIATFPRFQKTNRMAPGYDAELRAPSLDRNDEALVRQSVVVTGAGVDPGLRVGIKLKALKEAVAPAAARAIAPLRDVMLGALQLTLATAFDTSTEQEVTGLLALHPLDADPGADADQFAVAVGGRIILPIQSLTPADQDDTASALRVSAIARASGSLAVRPPDPNAPLLFPLVTPKPSGILKLQADEAVTRDLDQTLSLAVRAFDQSSVASEEPAVVGRVLIVDPAPFRVTAVEYTPITAAVTAENNEVAVWNESGEGGLSWRVRDDGQSVTLVMPPAAIGEAMEKNRSGAAGLPRDVEPGLPSAARFGSATIARIDPTFAETRFREPGWNLRRTLGSAEQRLPGARLLELRLELLYGMLARVRTQGLFMTELAGAIGAPPDPIPSPVRGTADAIADHIRLVNALLAAERYRLAADKLYRTTPDEFLRLDDGVTFKIRRRAPKADGDQKGAIDGGPSTPFRWPVGGDVPEDTGGLIDPRVLAATFSTSQRDEESFPGGLAWAFESANVLMSVFGRPTSDGGNLGGVYLTSHGGYGSQRALFDNRRSIVETETTQGRLQRYRLERIGRIAGLWHPAKHVIVYERTVVPSPQFFNQPPIGLRQDEHLGRAIPRKVEEFVEILKPVRRYPEDGTSTKACGFLLGAEFKSIKIRVDSAWGADVRREGWKVPLWNIAFEVKTPEGPADPDDPSALYPKPQIRLSMAGPSGDVVKEIDEPEKLYLYTSVVPGEDDQTDLWAPVRDVDFCDLPLPNIGTSIPPASGDLTDAMLPSEPEHVPGYERFTIGLVPSNDTVSIAHARADNGPVATLRNVTIARAAAISVPDEVTSRFGANITTATADIRLQIDRQIGQVVGALEQLDRNLRDPKEIEQRAHDLVAQALSRIQNLDGIIGKNAPASIQNFFNTIPKLGDVNGLCQSLQEKVRAEINGRIARFRAVATAALTQSADVIAGRVSAAGAIVDGEVARVTGLIARAEDLAGRLPALGTALGTQVQAELDTLAKTAESALQDLESQSVGRIEARRKEIVDGLGSLTSEIEADLEALRQRTSTSLEAIRQMVGAKIKADASQLEKQLTETVKAADALIDELQKAASTGAGTVTQACKDTAAATLKTVAAARSELARLLTTLTQQKAPAPVLRFIPLVDQQLAAVETQARRLATIDLAQSAPAKAFFEALSTIRKNLDGAATDLTKQIDSVATGAGAVLDTIDDGLQNLLQQAFDRVAVVVKSVKDQLTAITQAVDAVVAQWKSAITDAFKLTRGQVTELKAAIAEAAGKVTKRLQAALKDFSDIAGRDVAKLKALLKGPLELLGKIRGDLLLLIDAKKVELEKALDQVAAGVQKAILDLLANVSDLCKQFGDFLTHIQLQFKQWVEDTFHLDTYKQRLETELAQAMAAGRSSIAELKAQVAATAAEITRDAEARVRQLTGTVQQAVRDTLGADLDTVARRAEGVYQKGDAALRTLRALGDPPRTDSLGFNRPEVAYVLGEAKKLGIDMTPALALVNRAADQVAAVDQAGKAVGELLDSFGIRLPVNNIADQLMPQQLKGLSVADLLPDMAGIDFKGLLQRVGFPDLDDSNAVKVRHGFDKAERRAWMEADLAVPFAEAVPLLSFGPVQIIIDTARFTSHARLSAGLDGVERRMNGNIFGDWRVVTGGQTILTFRQTGLYFDDSGKIDFRIQPDRVEIAAALAFITDLMKASGQKGGLRVQPFIRGGIPCGVAATLDIAIPPIQTGAFGISDLSLHVLFGVAALPRFELVTELAVGSRMAPFTLNVWILNGGGYLTMRLSFVPAVKPQLLTYTLDIGILVGLGIGFSAGIVSGGVWLQVGCGMALTWTTGAGGNTTTVRVFLLARGCVDVAGIVTASITLLFEVSYDGERMIGAGTLSIRIKISVFFELSVDEHVEYVFAGEKKKEVSDESYAESYC